MKKLLIMCVATFGLMGITACGDEKTDEPEIVADAGIDVVVDAGKDETDAGEDEGDASVEEPKGCLIDGNACELGKKCDTTTGECVVDESVPAEPMHELGAKCDPETFTEYCTADNQGVYCSGGEVDILPCGEFDLTCRSLVGENFIDCYESVVENECDLNTQYGKGCGSESEVEYIIARECKATSSGVNVFYENWDSFDKENDICEAACTPGATDAEDAMCAEIETCDSKTYVESCDGNVISYCEEGNVVTGTCSTGTTCRVTDVGEGELPYADCFSAEDACQAGDADKLECDEYLSMGILPYPASFGYTCTKMQGTDSYYWVMNDNSALCNGECDDSTGKCIVYSEDEGKECTSATYVPKCENNAVIYCYDFDTSNEVVAEACGEGSLCVETEGAEPVPMCVAATDTCTTVGEKKSVCETTEFWGMTWSETYSYVCTDMKGSDTHYYVEDEEGYVKCELACNADFSACADPVEPPVTGECIENSAGTDRVCGDLDGTPASHETTCKKVDGKLQYVKDEIIYEVCDTCDSTTGRCVNFETCLNNETLCANNTNGKTECVVSGEGWLATKECLAPVVE